MARDPNPDNPDRAREEIEKKRVPKEKRVYPLTRTVRIVRKINPWAVLLIGFGDFSPLG
jgi:hypothetical protein